jgi:hypothetical protein
MGRIPQFDVAQHPSLSRRAVDRVDGVRGRPIISNFQKFASDMPGGGKTIFFLTFPAVSIYLQSH